MTNLGEIARPTATPPGSARLVARVWDRLLFLILQVAYYRFRYDVFVSYRRHHKPYVEKLKQQLEQIGYRAFFDREDCPPGSALNATLQKALLRSAALVLVGSPDVASHYVTMEVTTFGATGRSIIPIDIDGSLSSCSIPAIHERDLVWINESGAALDVGVPSPDVVAGIEANFTYLKRNLRQRIEGLLVALLVIAIAAASVQYARRNVSAARQQEQAAAAKTRLAEANATAAEGKRVKAETDAAAADRLRQDAIQLREAARRAAQEEQGQRAALLASEPGREYDALLAGVLAVGPEVTAGRIPPAAAMHGVSEAVAAAVRSLPMDAGWTGDARVTDDGHRIVSLGADGIRWWEIESGRMIRHIPAPANSTHATFCGESGLIVTGGMPRLTKPAEIRFRDIATGNTWAGIRPGTARAATACSRDRRWAVVVQDDREHLWSLRPAQDLGPFPSLGSEPPPQFSADGTRLISASGIFEIPSRRLVAPLQSPASATARKNVMASAEFRFFSFFGNDRFIAGASPLGNVVIWNAEDGTHVHGFEVTKPRYGVHYLGTRERVHPTIDAMTISPDGKHIAVADIDNRITVWSTQPGTKGPLSFLNVMAIEDAPQRLKISFDGFGQAEFGAVTALRFFDDNTLVFITEAGRAYVHRFYADMGLQKRVAVQEPRFVTDESAFKAGLKPSFTFDRRGLELVTFGCFAGMRRWSLGEGGLPAIDPPLMRWGADVLKAVLRKPARQVPGADRAIESKIAAGDPQDAVWYLHRACRMLREADRPKVAEFCPAASR